MMSAERCLKEAFAALLRGDTAERDRWCRLAENILSAQDRIRQSGSVSEINIGEPIRLPDRTKEQP